MISSALGTAAKTRLIDHNPAEYAQLPRIRRRKPLVWTPERIARWRQTGKVPGRVMVWGPDTCGAFLDYIEARRDRLYELYHLVATRGLRRAEVCGIRWEDTDLDGGKTIGVLESEDDDDDCLKSESSWRTVALDAENVDNLKAWRARQNRDRLAAGQDWIDSGLIFTAEDGRPLREEYVSERFTALIEAADIPPIRFHDLRHCAATLMLAAGVDMKVVQETLGHARHAFTADTYTSAIPELATAAAEATVAIIPRKRRTNG